MKYSLKTKIALMITAIWLTIFSHPSIAGVALPPLPSENAIEEADASEQQGVDDSKGWWQQFKDYIGFGSAEDTSASEDEDYEDELDFADSVKESEMNQEIVTGLEETDEMDLDVPDQLDLPDDFVAGIEVERNEVATEKAPKVVDIKNIPQVVQKDTGKEVLVEPSYAKDTSSQNGLNELGDEYDIPTLDEGGELTVTYEPTASGATNRATEQLPATSAKQTNMPVQDMTKEKNTSAQDISQGSTVNDQKEEMASTVSVDPSVVAAEPEEVTLSYVPNYGGSASDDANKIASQSASGQEAQGRVAKSELSKVQAAEDKARLDKEEQKAIDQFATNELQVLLLPSDDVVMGELTMSARLKQMSLSDYIQFFWEEYGRVARSDEREQIEEFIENYDENFN